MSGKKIIEGLRQAVEVAPYVQLAHDDAKRIADLEAENDRLTVRAADQEDRAERAEDRVRELERFVAYLKTLLLGVDDALAVIGVSPDQEPRARIKQAVAADKRPDWLNVP